MITIFTPTYNRRYRIKDLYDSLCRQTCRDFEWLVVDDGSTDDTESLFKEFIAENKIDIRYFKQPNGGKHRAINYGVREARGDLFFIVDSDDYLTPNAVEWMSAEWDKIKYDESFAGVSGIRITPDGKRIGGDGDWQVLDCTPSELRLAHNVKGDMSEAWRTETLKRFPFPEIDGERFCPEDLVWNRISAARLKVRFANKGIYVCEYLPDGLTASITKIRMYSPVASMMTYAELMRLDIPVAQKIKAAINYWRFSFCAKKRSVEISLWAYPFAPLGWLMHINDKKIIK